MLLGLSLLFVGAVLVLNGLWLLGLIDDCEIVVANVASGFVNLCVSFYLMFGPEADAGTIRTGALTLLFAITYLWVAYNRFAYVDGRGLGWFSLFVAITAVPVAISGFASTVTGIDIWMSWNWCGWAVLWFMYFLLLAQKMPIVKLVGVATLACGVFTGWLPGLLVLEGWLQP